MGLCDEAASVGPSEGVEKVGFLVSNDVFCINGGWRFRSHARFQTSKFQPSIGNFDFFNTL